MVVPTCGFFHRIYATCDRFRGTFVLTRFASNAVHSAAQTPCTQGILRHIMRKFIVTLGVLLIAVALAGPYFTGKLAEQAVVGNDASIQASLPPWLELVEQTFDRDWFSSRSSARLVITDQEKRQQFEQFLDGGTFGDQPAVLIDSVIAHGPLIGLFTPAIAELATAFRTETSEGGYLPVELTTTVGFSGDLDMEWRVVDSAFPSNFGTLGWKGLSVENTLSPTGRNLSVSLTADEFKVERDNNPITATDLEVDWISAEANGQFASSIALLCRLTSPWACRKWRLRRCLHSRGLCERAFPAQTS